MRLRAEIAPYDTVAQTLLSPPSNDADFAVVWTRPEAILPSFARLLAGDDVGADDLLGDVDRFADLVGRGAADFGCMIVPTWTVAPWLAGGALTDSRPGGIVWALGLANQRLMEATSQLTNVFVLDARRWLAAAADAYSERLWFMGKVPFDERVFERAADDVAAALHRGAGRGAQARRRRPRQHALGRRRRRRRLGVAAARRPRQRRRGLRRVPARPCSS